MKNVKLLLLFVAVENEKLSINEVLEVLILIGVGTFISTSRKFVTFYFLLGSSIQCLLSVGIRSCLTQRDVCRKIGQMHLSIVEEYFTVEVSHNSQFMYRFNVQTLHPKSFFADFTQFFKILLLVWYLSIVSQCYNYDINLGPIICLPFFRCSAAIQQ